MEIFDNALGRHAKPDKSANEKSRREKPAEYPERFSVPDDKVSWSVPFPEYRPPYYVSEKVLSGEGPESENFAAAGLKQPSYADTIAYSEKGLPLNPRGRTGLEGRGRLRYWGPNLAVDPIVLAEGRGSVKLLVIRRSDNGQLALPGGKLEIGEEIDETLSRELEEETSVQLDMSDGSEIYRGYSDDRRNTDNAWMETVGKYKVLTAGEFSAIPPELSGDQDEVAWVDITKENLENFYGAHKDLVVLAVRDLLGKQSLAPETAAALADLLREVDN